MDQTVAFDPKDTTFGQHASHLASEIITEQFGDVVGKVCHELLFKGELAVPQIAKNTALDISVVKKSLLILIQHNCVSFREEEKQVQTKEKVEDKKDTPPSNDNATPKKEKAKTIKLSFYSAMLSSILQRIRFPKFILQAKDKYGNEGETIVEEILTNGRLTMEQTIKQAISLSSAIIGNVEDQQQSALLDVFEKLVQDNYLADCSQEITTKSRNLNANFNFSAESHAKSGEQVFWRVNYEKFNVHYLSEACVSLVREKYDQKVGNIIAAAFQIIEPFITNPPSSISHTFTVEQVTETYNQDNDMITENSNRTTMTTTEVAKYLEMLSLSRSSIQLMSRVSGEGVQASYTMNLAIIGDVLKHRLVESIIQQKFGAPSARIWRLLFDKKQVEQRQIASVCMIPIKETRERLYKLLAAGYIHLQEVPKTADHAPARTFYLWFVKFDSLCEQIAAEMYKTMRNLRMRLKHYLMKHQDLVARALEVQNSQNVDPDVVFTETEKGTLQKLEIVQNHLESSILAVDESLILLNK